MCMVWREAGPIVDFVVLDPEKQVRKDAVITRPSIAQSSRSSRRHAVAPRWGRRPQRHSGGGRPAPKAATRVAASTPHPSI